MMDTKVAAISCVNSDFEYEEQLYYLKRQILPDGFKMDFIPVRGAASMAAGYNTAMKSSDAKYKIYLHQDAFLVYDKAIADALKIFVENENVGLIGVIGVSSLAENGIHTMDYNRGGIDHNGTPRRLTYDYKYSKKGFSHTDTVDGAVIITAKDIPWREDLFDMWDFYDASQCQEYLRAGYDIAVPNQEIPWCYHDNTYSNLTNYYKYKQIFLKEYFGEDEYILGESALRSLEYANIQKNTLQAISEIAKSGQRQALYEIFKMNEYRGHAHLRELEALAGIDFVEQGAASDVLLWPQGKDYENALVSLRGLKHKLKRIEYKAYEGETDVAIEKICQEYSVYAVIEIIEKYCIDKNALQALFLNFYSENQMPQAMVMERVLSS